MRHDETSKMHLHKNDMIKNETKDILNNIFRIFWTFFAGGVAGVIIETIWCYFAFGGLSSRTSNLFFPFSIVWGTGAVLLLLVLNHSRSDSVIITFLQGCILAGLFEFTCGYIGEQVWNVTFWDYSRLPLHIGRYVNVYICILWGLMCVGCQKWIYPFWNTKVNELLKQRISKGLTIVLIIFMVLTNAISGLALVRMTARSSSTAAVNIVDHLLDTHFPDQKLQQYFPKMKYLTGEKIYPSGKKKETPK